MLKKLFALGLATVMALGTTMSAFAAEPDVGTNTTRAHDMEQKKVLVGSIQKTIPVCPNNYLKDMLVIRGRGEFILMQTEGML